MRAPAIAAVVALAALATGCGEVHDVTERWTEGEVRRYRYTLDIEGTHRSGSAGRFVSTFETEETATDVVPRDRAVIRTSPTRVVLEITNRDAETVQRFDSDEPDEETDGKMNFFRRRSRGLRRVVGVRFDVVRKPSGIIDGIRSLEQAGRQAAEGLAPDDPRLETIASILQPPPLKSQLENVILFPSGGTKPNESWNVGGFLPLPETAGIEHLTMLYVDGVASLVSVADGVARIEAEGRVSLDPPERAPPLPEKFRGLRDLLRLPDGRWTAHCLVHVETGRLEEAEMTFDLSSLEFEKLGGEGIVKIPQVIKRTIERLD